jgi:hypothetical protein
LQVGIPFVRRKMIIDSNHDTVRNRFSGSNILQKNLILRLDTRTTILSVNVEPIISNWMKTVMM